MNIKHLELFAKLIKQEHLLLLHAHDVGEFMSFIRITTLILTIMFMTGCFQVSQTKMAKEGGTSVGDEPQITKTEYALNSVATMESILVNVLEVPTTDPAVTKLRANAIALGSGDPTQNLPADPSFSALKGKLISEIYVDGCTTGLQKATVQAKLFPKGFRDYDAIFLTFTGRKPTDEEIAVLDDLNSRVSEQVAPAAACSAILSSIEPMNRT